MANAYKLVLLTAKGCSACEKLTSDNLREALRQFGTDRATHIHFSDLNAKRILYARDSPSDSPSDSDIEAEHFPAAAAFRPYTFAFPMWIVVSKSEWQRASEARPGFSHPGSPELFARVPLGETTVTAFGPCDTKYYSVRMAPRQTTAPIANLLRETAPEAPSGPSTRYISRAERAREAHLKRGE